MELSCKSEYALLALLELTASHTQGEPLQSRQIAAQQDIPERYLEQLLATLRRAGIVRSQRGAKGGYLLNRDPWQISLLDVVRCIEGLEALGDTKLRKPTDSQTEQTIEGAVVMEIWQEARQAAEAILQGYTLQDLAERRAHRQQLDIMYYI